MKYAIVFGFIAVVLFAMAIIWGGWFYGLLWPASSLAIVASGYLLFGAAVFRKSRQGELSLVRTLLLLPYLVSLWSVWNIVRVVQREPAIDQLTERIFIGRRLLSEDLPDYIDHVIDLTCEFSEPKALRQRSYSSYPILDAAAPTIVQLCEWSYAASKLPGNIYIHCAQGSGRTGMFAGAILLRLGVCSSAEEAIAFIQSKRPSVRLSKGQRNVLQRFSALDK